jgi:hypothetical protein
MVHLNRLEGPALEAYLLLRRQMMVEAARINRMDFRTAWDIPSPPPPETVTYKSLVPGPNAALKIQDLKPEHLGITCNSTTEYGYLFTLAGGENKEAVSKTIDNGRVIGIYGIVDSTPSPALVQIDVNIGNREARVWPVRPGLSEINDAMYFLDPIFVQEAQKLTIDLWAATASSERITFLGLYISPKE